MLWGDLTKSPLFCTLLMNPNSSCALLTTLSTYCATFIWLCIVSGTLVPTLLSFWKLSFHLCPFCLNIFFHDLLSVCHSTSILPPVRYSIIESYSTGMGSSAGHIHADLFAHLYQSDLTALGLHASMLCPSNRLLNGMIQLHLSSKVYHISLLCIIYKFYTLDCTV